MLAANVYRQQIQLQIKKIIICEIAAAPPDSVFMTVSPSISTNTPNLRSATPIPINNRRIRISGRLLGICDTVYIPELEYNGTIIDIVGRFVVVLPHDYGHSIRRLPRNLETGNGISSHQRHWLDRINVAYHDNTLLLQGTFPNRQRGKCFI